MGKGFGFAVGELLTALVAEAGEPLEIHIGGDLKVVQLAKAVGHFLLFRDVAFVFDLKLDLLCHLGRNGVAQRSN